MNIVVEFWVDIKFYHSTYSYNVTAEDELTSSYGLELTIPLKRHTSAQNSG